MKQIKIKFHASGTLRLKRVWALFSASVSRVKTKKLVRIGFFAFTFRRYVGTRRNHRRWHVWEGEKDSRRDFGNELVADDDDFEETEQDDDVGESSFWGCIINV